MAARTVNWTALRNPTEPPSTEGLRERKKRLMRQQLSDTATEMFVERGFDAVRVAEVADACGVSEKTVFNYFPTKESLVLDLSDATMNALRAGLADPAVPPVEAVLRILDDQLTAITSWLAEQDDPAEAAGRFRRFGRLIQTTPSLRAHQRDQTDHLVATASALLAARAGLTPDAPEPRIAATALLGLWQIQFQSLGRHLDPGRSSAGVRKAVIADVHRAADLLDAGLRTFGG
ncbi:MAG: TetR family transcriptional regulator [Umezawaea sp.]